MGEKFSYRLSENQKNEIAQNLIDILQKDTKINTETIEFISHWLNTRPEEKRKAFFDVWDIVLKKYLPTTRPILFRACTRISKYGKIASFTGSLQSAYKFAKGKGFLIICDTSETLRLEEKYYEKKGEYRNTFYPLVSVLKKMKDENVFSNHNLEFIKEDEYIMKVSGTMYGVKWLKNNF